MKIFNILSILMLFVVLNTNAQTIPTADLQVTGLTCSMCSNATEKSLRTLNFISNIEPDLNKNIFVLTFKPNAKINLDQLAKKVQDAGFSVGDLTANFTFEDVAVDENGMATIGSNVYQFVNVKNKTLSGTVKATIIDKNFVSGSTFKKHAAAVNSESYKTGTAVIKGKKVRVYHLSVS